MKLALKLFLTLTLVCSIGAWGQDGGSCHAASVAGVQTRCPCTGAPMIINECQGSFGPGCKDLGFTDFCGPTCAVEGATGCTLGGPKAFVPMSPTAKLLDSEISRLFARQAHASFVTCAGDNNAFEMWLLRTHSPRSAQP